LPKEGGIFVPTLQLKSGQVKVQFKFDVPVPKDKSKIPEIAFNQEGDEPGRPSNITREY
jgi:hypothetical protein